MSKNESTRSVLKKIVYYVSVELASPVSISKGDGTLTDSDVLVNGDGMPFIPGSSLVGAMRDYIGKVKSEDCIFGYEDMEYQKGRMSSLYVSDLYFDTATSVVIRDGVSLDDKKTAIAGEKFDMEVLDTGAKGHFWIEFVSREKDDEAFKKELEQIFNGWREKEIRLGSKKTRGFGEVSLLSVKKKEFDEKNILSDYKNVYSHTAEEYAKWDDLNIDASETKYVTVSVPLRLEGGISIRQYIAKKNEPDFVHITANGKPVIPGTSFAGAIRHRLREILIALDVKKVDDVIEGIFGYVKIEKIGEKKEREEEIKAQISQIIISECVLEGSKELEMVRNGISRFESGTKSGALFKEKSYVGGTTTLEIKVKITEFTDSIIGLLLLVLKDIQNGFLAVGGQTAIGRGLFSGNGEIKCSSPKEEKKYLEAAMVTLKRS